ncbi:MAG: VWA domain-containing protein [Eubacteriaceae bacterium]|nr:VWA domain-containing protein [Eubacteriaceae bacterium]
MANITFPFAAVIGQEKAKNALIWNIINPKIGGVLISGEKGTAKSTLVRGLAGIAPWIKIINLPLNISEDMLIGSIDFEHAVKHGEKRFEPGLLYYANGGAIYVDEVNLLSDHIAKSLLEAASSGECIVEREGLSYRHEARFFLIGSMNPEEGGLRPQLLDRFGLFVEAEGEHDLRKRAEIARRRLEYEKSPSLFEGKWLAETKKLAVSIERARNTLLRVEVTENAMRLAASFAQESNCAGHRAEIAIIETAKAITAFDSRTVLSIDDISEAAKYALPHRARQQEENRQQQSPPDPELEPDASEADSNSQERRQESEPAENSRPERESSDPEDIESGKQDISENGNSEASEAEQEAPEQIFDPAEAFEVSSWLKETRGAIVKKGSGKRSLVTTGSKHGRYVRYTLPKGSDISDIALGATLRAAAANTKIRHANGMAVSISEDDIRIKIRERRTGNTIVFVVDASGSMGARRQMSAVKGAILSLLNDAYRKRDKVSLIAFRKESAELLLGITRSVDLAEKQLSVLPTGGLTPLAAGIDMAYDIVKAAQIKDKDLLPVIVLVTDGRATYSDNSPDAFADALRAASRIGASKYKAVVIDSDRNFVRLQLAEKLAEAMNADCYQIEDLHAASVLAAVALSL